MVCNEVHYCLKTVDLFHKIVQFCNTPINVLFINDTMLHSLSVITGYYTNTSQSHPPKAEHG